MFPSIYSIFLTKYSTKHLLHCAALLAIMTCSITRFVLKEYDFQYEECPMLFKVFLWFLYVTSLIRLPTCLATTFALLVYDCFPGDVKLRADLRRLPTICFRVVTRGDYPKLIRKNMERNVRTCTEVGLTNFIYEVVTQTPIESISDHPLVRQVVVPPDYVTPKGSLFKARNLQYCLEDKVNVLKDDDWIVHLDEDSVLTANSVKGVANFVADDRHCFGNGVINLNFEGSNSILAKIVDLTPIFDYGVIKFQIKCLGKSYYGFRDTFLVAKVRAEKDVTFDMEAGPSLAEDTAFGIMSVLKGYTLGSVEGEVLEQGSSSYHECLRRYSRIAKGHDAIYMTSCNLKSFAMCAFMWINGMAWAFNFPGIIFSYWYPLPLGALSLAFNGFMVAINVYFQIFLVFKNYHRNWAELIFTLFVSVLIGIPLQFYILFYVLFDKAEQLSFNISEKTE